MESIGLNGHVTIIDGSPEMLSSIVRTHKIGKSETDFQNYILGYLVTVLYQNVDRSKLEYLLKTETWDEKCEKTINLCMDIGYKYGRDDLNCFLNAYYGRASILAAMKEDYEIIENTNCTFIRPSEAMIEHESECYELKNYFKNNIEVYCVQGNHQTMLENPEIVQIINRIK